MTRETLEANKSVFQSRLKDYKTLIDDDIAAYAKRVSARTLQDYGKYSRVASDAYFDILARGGKRIRGALVLLGYEMSGGKNRDLALEAARAIEMMHAYILIIDDIQDRSSIRRGGPAAHKILEQYHRDKYLAGEAEHFGVAVALNSALGGAHAAQMILATLDCDEEIRTKVLGIMNRTMLVTAHGQTNDIVNELIADVDEQAVERVLEWKTAHYTFLNPLHVGMVLAGADCHDTDAVTDYAMFAGKAFQITDDILGTFGAEQESGKSPMDDIREGKRTLLTVYALEHAGQADQNFLIQTLGNQHITPAEFERCKHILQDSGALDYARKQAEHNATKAIESLTSHATRWSEEGVAFLSGLAQYLLTRTT
ncbi:MAG: polyprenyl synthetase family protein [Candidatus Saccharibacteria bacterium]|nr:polyprenyl synthetase family protein [Candidatus Saccharibacteria bacterium]